MPKLNGKDRLLDLDKVVEGFAESNFQLGIDELLKEMMPLVEAGEFYDSSDLQSIAPEEILSSGKTLTEVEQRLWDAADSLNSEFGLPKAIFSPLLVLILLALSKGNANESKALTNVFFSYIAYRSSFEKAPSKLGALGGRPTHPRKEETLGLARQRWKHLPRASLSSVATYVKSQLDAKYTDAPKLPSIKNWLKTEKTAKLN